MDREAQLRREALASEYNLWMKGICGRDFLERLETLHNRLLREAKSKSDPAQAQMLLQRAVGVDEVKAEISRLIAPIDDKHKRLDNSK